MGPTSYSRCLPDSTITTKTVLGNEGPLAMPHVLFRYKNQHRNFDKKAVNNVEHNFQLDIHTDRLIPVHARKLLNMVNICFIAEGQYHMITLALYISIFLCFCGFESGENYISDAVSFLCHHLIAIINAQVCDKINVVIACYLMAPPPPPPSFLRVTWTAMQNTNGNIKQFIWTNDHQKRTFLP